MPRIFNESDFAAPTESSTLGDVGQAVLRGTGNFLDLIGQVLPQQNQSTATGLDWPRFFGLGPSGGMTIGEQFKKDTENLGLTDKLDPQAKHSLAANAIEQGLSFPAGPAASLFNAIFGGAGAYGGERIGPKIGVQPSTGRAIGAITTSLTPSAAKWSGITKEIADFFGPTVSQFPILNRVFGDSAIKSAVGKTLTDAAGENADDVISALNNAPSLNNLSHAPADEFSQFKTAAEVAGSPGLARLTDAADTMLPSAGLKEMSEGRKAAQVGKLTELGLDASAGKYETSKALEGALGKAATNADEAEKVLWGVLPKETKVPIGNAIQSAAQKIDDLNLGVLPEDSSTKALFGMLQEGWNKGELSLGQLQKVRSRALEIARNGARATNLADKDAGRAASIIADELLGAVDGAAQSGAVPDSVASLWGAARDVTRNNIETFGATRGLKAAMGGEAMDNVSMLAEGLTSPDKLGAHLAAAERGGVDIKPLYKQAFLSMFEGKSPNSWVDILATKRPQLEKVLTVGEMKQLEAVVADTEAAKAAAGLAQTAVGNSMTAPRQSAIDFINQYKGFAGLPFVRNASPILGATTGAIGGFESGNTPYARLRNAFLGAAGGFLTGKALKSTGGAASNAYDLLLSSALKDPKQAAALMEGVQPGQFSQLVKQGLVEGGQSMAARAGGMALNKILSPKESQQPDSSVQIKPRVFDESDFAPSSAPENPHVQLLDSVFGEPMQNTPIDLNKLVDAVIQQESGGNHRAVSDVGAQGLMQIMPATGKELAAKYGVGDYEPFNAEQNKKLGTLYLKELLDRYNGDPELALTAYHTGMGTVSRLLAEKNGSKLSDILDDLGPAGKVYAKQVLGRMV